MNARPYLFACVALLGCSDDDDNGPGPDGDLGPAYVMMTQVYTADDRMVSISVSDTLDLTSVSLADAHVEQSVANFSAIGGKLYISSGEAPKITQYDVRADLSFAQTGEISFAAYPFSDNANFYYHYIVDEDLAYLPYDVVRRIAWSPKDMAILADATDSALSVTQGALMLSGGGNRSAVKYPRGPIVQPFYYNDATYLEYGTQSQIATYDAATHTEARVQSAPCLGLSITTRDEDNRTYLSTNNYSPVKKLYDAGPAPCVVRLDATGAIDAAWTTDLSAQTGGRYVMNYRYLAGGFAVGNVLDADKLDADFNGAYDPAVEDQIYEAGNFRLWLFDVEAGTAKPIEGIDLPVASGGQTAVIDGRMFVFVIFNEYGSTRVYEVSEAGVATKKFDVAGDVFKWEKLR